MSRRMDEKHLSIEQNILEAYENKKKYFTTAY